MINTILLHAGGGGGGFGVQQLIFFGLIFAVFYFFMIRPQQKKQKELRQFRESIKKGDEVVTTGGIFGKVLSVEDDVLILEVDRGVKLKVYKSSVNAPTVSEKSKK